MEPKLFHQPSSATEVPQAARGLSAACPGGPGPPQERGLRGLAKSQAPAETQGREAERK